MSRQLQIGNDIFSYPDEGDEQGWGDDATEWAQAVTDALATVVGPNDILITSVTLSNNQSTPVDIAGLSFNLAEVEAVEIDYYITRSFNLGADTVSESGKILGNFDGSEFFISPEANGDAGISFTATNAGQIQYTSTDLTDHISTTIRFKAQTIDTP